jgi:hypothetical protein
MRGFTRATRPTRLLLAGAFAALAVIGLALGACSKKITSVDTQFTAPEGVESPEARMVTWYDGFGQMDVYDDNPPAGPAVDEFCGLLSPGDGDVLVASLAYWRPPLGTVTGMIFDGTPSTAYQVLRREAGGGYRRFRDFTLPPLRRWLTSQWEVYRFRDDTPSSFTPATYVGRGLIGGALTLKAPLTNPGIARGASIGEIAYLGTCNPRDSLFTMRWSEVPGAMRYWVNVYRFSRPPAAPDLLESSLPSAVNEILPSDIFVGYVDTVHVDGGGFLPPATSYKLGDTSRQDVRILLQRGLTFGGTYFVRVAAVDSMGQLIACTRGDYGRINLEGQYALFRLGAAIVAPSRPAALAADGRPVSAWDVFESECGPVSLARGDLKSLLSGGRGLRFRPSRSRR